MPCPRHGKGPGGCPRFRWEGSGGERFLGEINSPGPPMTQGRRRRSCCVFPSARGGKVPAVLWKSAAFCGSSAVPMPFRGKNAPGAVPCRKGRVRKGLPYRMAAGCGMFRLAAFGRRPPCERVLRTRSRRPTPSRRCRAVVSREGMARAGERCTRALALFRPRSGTTFSPTYYPAFVCGRKPLRFMLFLFAEEYLFSTLRAPGAFKRPGLYRVSCADGVSRPPAVI